MTVNRGIIGRSYRELDTPALLIDLDVMESNIARMARTFREAGVGWRPHTKGIKIPAIAHKLLGAGAIGITCAKLGEAEVMASAGIRDILIANQIVGPQKTSRLAALCRHADPIVAVDSQENVRELDAAAQEWGVRLRVVIEVNVGMNRCGVEPGEPVLALAKQIVECPGLRFAGLMTWESNALSVEQERRAAEVERSLGLLTNSAAICRETGIPVEIVSCGGSADYWLAAQAKGVTEIEAGGGIFGDRYYQAYSAPVKPALTVLSTVISRPSPSRIVTDSGAKSIGSDRHGEPRPKDVPGVQSINLAAEHGIIYLELPASEPRIGEKLEWAVGYGDFTVFLHEHAYGIRHGVVETMWPVLGRGKLQ